MYYAPKHCAASTCSQLRKRIVSIAIAAAAILVTAVALSPPAQASGSVWDAVASCESGGNWAIDTGNSFYGGLQFTHQTWLGYGGGAYAANANLASRPAQITIAERVLAGQGPGAWPVCGPRAGLSRATAGAPAVSVSRSRTRVAIAAPTAPAVRARLVVDGQMGPKTIRAMQRWVGTAQNGVLDARSVKALKIKVHVVPSGVIGSRTVRALQVRIGAHRDGARSLNAATVVSLQRYLNRH